MVAADAVDGAPATEWVEDDWAKLCAASGSGTRREALARWVLAVGAHEWENEFVDRMWTYSLDAVWSGVQAAYADLAVDVERRYGVRPETYGAMTEI